MESLERNNLEISEGGLAMWRLESGPVPELFKADKNIKAV